MGDMADFTNFTYSGNLCAEPKKYKQHKPKRTWEEKAREFNERQDTRTMPEVMKDIWENGFQ
jgi:hypothetical protein